MAAPARKPAEHKPAEKKTVEHCFVVSSQCTSAHRHGPFVDREAALKWAAKHYASWPCWLLPAEYIGSVPPRCLDADGNLISGE